MPFGSGKSVKIEDRFARVARVSLSRSSFGPGWVRSWGRIRPGPYSSTRTRAKKPVRLRRAARGQVGAHGVVDDVVGRRDHIAQRADGGGLVAKRAERLQVGHPKAPG